MKSILILIVSLSFSISALGQSEPVIVTIPKGVPIQVQVDSSKLFIVHIAKDSLTAWFNNKWTKLENVEQLDSLIKSNIAVIMQDIKQEQPILRCGKNVPYDKAQKVIDIFNKNTLGRFILETKHN